MLVYLFFIVGFIFLIKSAELLIDGASALAKKLRFSDLFIGLTIVAFGTSAPELIINITSNLKGAADLAMGNAIGASISNILLVAGLAAMIYPIRIRKKHDGHEVAWGVMAIAILLFLANNFFFISSPIISRLDGALMIIFFAAFLYYAFGESKRKEKEELPDGQKKLGLLVSLAYIAIGIIGLSIGADWVVGGAVAIAEKFGLSQTLIGLTILAIGTTLPEMTASIVAALKKEADIAFGNVIGSTVFNLTFVLGTSAVVRPLIFDSKLNMDILFAAAALLILFLLILLGKKKNQIERKEGAILFGCYLVYLGFLVWRG